MIWVVHPGSRFFTHPGIKKAPDPGSATLLAEKARHSLPPPTPPKRRMLACSFESCFTYNYINNALIKPEQDPRIGTATRWKDNIWICIRVGNKPLAVPNTGCCTLNPPEQDPCNHTRGRSSSGQTAFGQF
jgi:hypothetical protein